MGERTTLVDTTRRERWKKEKMTRGGGRTQFRVAFRADFPSFAVQPRNDAIVAAHFGPRWPGAQNGPVYRDSTGRADGVGRGRAKLGEQGASEDEGAHLGGGMAHPARARRRVRAARDFISPEVAGAPIYMYSLGGGIGIVFRTRRTLIYNTVL
jgi:hypothetical protein